jgi:hypothetical protein
MTIYQVINAQNYLEYAYLNYEAAAKQLAKLNKRKGANYSIKEVQDEFYN